MVAMGMQREVVAKVIGITKPTLIKYFREELDTASPKANAAVAAALYNKAISPDHPQAATCAIFWLKCRAGWKPQEGLQIGGDPDNPLRTETEVKIDFSGLTQEERDVVRGILGRRASQP